MEENTALTEEEKFEEKELKEEFRIPQNIVLTDSMKEKLRFKLKIKTILELEDYPMQAMKLLDDELKIWKLVINNRNKIVPFINGKIPDLDIPCIVNEHGANIIFQGTKDDILTQLYLLVECSKNRFGYKTTYEEDDVIV